MGTLDDWHLKLWGEAADASKASLLPMPNENDDADHDVISSTITASAKTTSVSAGPQQTHHTTHPSDHPHRPTKAPKPTATEEEETTGTNVAQETTSSSWFSKLPSFGASKTAQIWIYGAVGLIILFCIGIGIYLYVVRRRRLRNDPRNNYEFELLDDEEREALNGGGGEKGPNGGRRSRRTRGGELYDAFAGGSDDDEDEGEERDGDAEFQDYRDNRSRDRLPDDDEQYVVGDESDDDGDLHEKGASPPQRAAGGR